MAVKTSCEACRNLLEPNVEHVSHDATMGHADARGIEADDG